MAMRKAKEGVVKDMAGNVIEDAKPSYTVQVRALSRFDSRLRLVLLHY